MLPNTSGIKKTKIQIFVYTLVLFFFSFMPYLFGFNHTFYLIFTAVFGLEFIRRSWECLKGSKNSEQKLFSFSIVYLFLLFLVILLDKLYFNIWKIMNNIIEPKFLKTYYKNKKQKNYVILFIILFFVILFFLITILRMNVGKWIVSY